MVDYYPWAIAGQPGSPTGGAYDYRGDPNAFTEGESYSAKNREGEEGRDPATSEFPSGDLALRVNLSGQANVAPQACPNNSFNGTGLETNRLQGSADAPAYPPEVPAGLKKTGLLGCFVRFFYGTGPDQFDWIYHYAVGDVTLRRGQWDWMFADEIDESTPWRLPMGMNCPDFYVGTGITSMRNDADQDITSARFNDRVWLRGRHLEDYSIAQVFLQSPGGTVSKPVVDSRSTDALSFIVDTLAKGRFYVWVFVDLGPGSSPSFPSVRLTSAEFIAIDLN
jgi:hypothetical protein